MDPRSGPHIITLPVLVRMEVADASPRAFRYARVDLDEVRVAQRALDEHVLPGIGEDVILTAIYE